MAATGERSPPAAAASLHAAARVALARHVVVGGEDAAVQLDVQADVRVEEEALQDHADDAVRDGLPPHEGHEVEGDGDAVEDGRRHDHALAVLFGAGYADGIERDGDDAADEDDGDEDAAHGDPRGSGGRRDGAAGVAGGVAARVEVVVAVGEGADGVRDDLGNGEVGDCGYDQAEDGDDEREDVDADDGAARVTAKAEADVALFLVFIFVVEFFNTLDNVAGRIVGDTALALASRGSGACSDARDVRLDIVGNLFAVAGIGIVLGRISHHIGGHGCLFAVMMGFVG